MEEKFYKNFKGMVIVSEILYITIVIITSMYFAILLVDKGIEFNMPIILFIFLFIFITVILIFLTVIVHELGHLTCGLKNGYELIEFNILSLSFYVRDKILKIRKSEYPGALGYCRMNINIKNGILPFMKYISSGIKFNLFSMLLFAISSIFSLFLHNAILAIFFLEGSLISYWFVHNNFFNNNVLFTISDGAYLKFLSKNDVNKDMVVKLLQNSNKSVTDLSDEFFENQDFNNIENGIQLTFARMYAMKLLFECKLDDANNLYNKILNGKLFIDLSDKKASEKRQIMYITYEIYSDMLLIEIIRDNKDEISNLKHKIPLINLTRDFYITYYYYVLLYEKNEESAMIYKKKFIEKFPKDMYNEFATTCKKIDEIVKKYREKETIN